MDADQIADAKTKMKESVADACAKALIDIESYTGMATSHPYASHQDVARAIAANRAAQDAVSMSKSNALIQVDNIAKEMQTDNL